jgi:serine protease inhibitor
MFDKNIAGSKGKGCIRIRQVSVSQIGLTDIFTARANLSGISVEPVAVSEVIQKAEIEVDEDGATAAAATGTANCYS